MERLVKHLGFIGHLDEFKFKGWLDSHSSEVLIEVGVSVGQSVLDFGCGSGTYTIPAAKLVGKNGRVYALDVSKKALDTVEKKARQEGLGNIVRIDASGRKDIPIEDESLNHVLLIDVLQEIEDGEALFGEVFRTLKPTGVVAVYPMHMAEVEWIGLATTAGLTLQERKLDGRMLIFSRLKSRSNGV